MDVDRITPGASILLGAGLSIRSWRPMLELDWRDGLAAFSWWHFWVTVRVYRRARPETYAVFMADRRAVSPSVKVEE